MGYQRLLDDRVVLISGGTMGVGAATAIAAAEAGASAVVISGRRPDKAEPTVARIRDTGAEALFVQADVADVEAAINTVEATVSAYGRIDCLVNAAAVVDRGTLLETTPEFFDWHVAVNLRAPFFTMQAAVRDMLTRQSPGSIVNILSTSMHVGQTILAAYVASKGGLAHVTKNAAHAHRFDRIRINGLNIGWRVRMRSSARLTERLTAGMPRRRRACRWANSVSPMRSRTSSSSCCRTAPVW